MNDIFNSQETLGRMNDVEENYSGEQEGVVGSPESQYGDDYDFTGDGQEEVVDPREEGGDEEGFEEGGNDPAVAGQDRAKTQTREDNSAARMARLHAQREADEKIARMGIKNPATGKPIKNMEELQTFSEQQREAEIRRLAKQSGRSVDDVRQEVEDREFIRKMREDEKAKSAAAAAAEKQKDFLVKDLCEFVKKHPEVDVNKLENNPRFLKFCGSRYGKEPLTELYENFMEITGEAESAGRAGAQSRRSRSTGSGGGGGEMLTPSQRASLDAWNRANPDMKMTAKEFLRK